MIFKSEFFLLFLFFYYGNCVRHDEKSERRLESDRNINITLPEADQIKWNDLNFYMETELKLSSDSKIIFNNWPLLPNFGFVIVQLHSYEYNVSLSYTNPMSPGQFEHGMNLGLIIYDQQPLYAFNSMSYTNVSIAIAVMVYDRTVPVPGGCNMEYPVFIAPIITITKHANDLLSIDTPLAATNMIDPTQSLCLSNQTIEYLHYHSYLPSGYISPRMYFDVIKGMIRIEDIIRNGTVGASNLGKSNRRSLVSAPGTGITIVTIASQTYPNKSWTFAAYVPAFTISCDPAFWNANCNIFYLNAISMIFIIVGLVRCYVSPCIPFFDVLMDYFLFGMAITFSICLSIYSDEDIELGWLQSVCITGGAVTAAVFIAINILLPPTLIISKFILSIIVGYIMGTILTALTNVTSGYDTGTYSSIVIVCISLSLLISSVAVHTNLLFSIGLGAFFIIIGYGWLFGAHFSHISMVTLPHIIVRDHLLATAYPPLQRFDYLLFGLALFIICTGFFVQKAIIKKRTGRQVPHGDEINERAPLISRWTNGSNEVFETPRTNDRFLQRVH